MKQRFFANFEEKNIFKKLPSMQRVDKPREPCPAFFLKTLLGMGMVPDKLGKVHPFYSNLGNFAIIAEQQCLIRTRDKVRNINFYRL